MPSEAEVKVMEEFKSDNRQNSQVSGEVEVKMMSEYIMIVYLYHSFESVNEEKGMSKARVISPCRNLPNNFWTLQIT